MNQNIFMQSFINLFLKIMNIISDFAVFYIFKKQHSITQKNGPINQPVLLCFMISSYSQGTSVDL